MAEIAVPRVIVTNRRRGCRSPFVARETLQRTFPRLAVSAFVAGQTILVGTVIVRGVRIGVILIAFVMARQTVFGGCEQTAVRLACRAEKILLVAEVAIPLGQVIGGVDRDRRIIVAVVIAGLTARDKHLCDCAEAQQQREQCPSCFHIFIRIVVRSNTHINRPSHNFRLPPNARQEEKVEYAKNT